MKVLKMDSRLLSYILELHSGVVRRELIRVLLLPWDLPMNLLVCEEQQARTQCYPNERRRGVPETEPLTLHQRADTLVTALSTLLEEIARI